ncbi:MAG: EAL domain-containing protein [Saccharofermentans sp.]|nr:EAL domain-containing protein [Saccharofermentans sp.]
MDYDERKMFWRGKTTFIVLCVIYSLLFLAGVFVQNFLFVDYARVFISIFLIVISFSFNLAFGAPGFWITTAYTIIQMIFYTYVYTQRKDETTIVLIGLSLLSLIILTLFQFFINRVSGRLDKLNRKLAIEKARRINSETTALIERNMVASGQQGIIVKHESIKDNDELKKSLHSSRDVALDSLTTLPNRHAISEHGDVKIYEYNRAYQDAAEIGKDFNINPIYVIYLTVHDDIRFSPSNGHIVVDLFIQTMAHRLREAADYSDFVGRIANNEFAVITTRFKEDSEVKAYAHSLSLALNDECEGKFYAGIAQYPRDSIYAGDLVTKAESALYKAISNDEEIGFYVSDKPNDRAVFLDRIEIDELKVLFDKAFEENELYMVYQPRFDADLKLTGFEAFVRWEFPGKGTVDTTDFLFYAEKTGHIYRLGEFSLMQAFETLARINKVDPNLTMTVNLSTTQLHMPDLQIDLLAAAEGVGINLKNLIIDIPSDGATINIQEVQNTLDALASSGIKMALDNFGRSYSSLNSIPLMPISLVKLDGNFTAALKEGSSQGVLTHSIISLLNEIDIPVDATGVGTQGQFERLKNYGCTYFQGNHLSEPILQGNVLEYVKSQKN